MELITNSMVFQTADGMSPVIPMLTTFLFY